MNIFLVGGGSGGHITPLLAIAEQLKSKKPDLRIIIISERGGRFSHYIKKDSLDYNSKSIFAGKFRRYYREPFWKSLLDVKRIMFNIRDIFLVIFGLLESIYLVALYRPKLIFIKGGFVGVPIGFSARLFRVKYITHDSDSVPGLANKLIAKNAVMNAVGMPVKYYGYPAEKANFVGVPVGNDFKKVDKQDRDKKRKATGLPSGGLILLITGGSNGAQRLDSIMHRINRQLLEELSNLYIVHQVGRGNQNIYDDYTEDLRKRITVKRHLDRFVDYSGSADLIVTRAGATSIAEFACQAKPIVVVPSPYLASGHQVKNAKILEDLKSAVIFQEDTATKKPEMMTDSIRRLLNNNSSRQLLAENLNKNFYRDATNSLVKIIIAKLK